MTFLCVLVCLHCAADHSRFSQEHIMASFNQACLLFFTCAFVVDAFTLKNCDSNTPVQVTSVTLSPSTLLLHEGATITYGGTVEIKEYAGLNYKFKLNVEKKLSSWVPVWVPIPCVHNMGSCTYSGLSCSGIWKKLDKPVQCPPPPDNYNLPTETITLSKVHLPSFLTSGTYRLKGKLINTDNNSVMACVVIEIEVDSTANSEEL